MSPTLTSRRRPAWEAYASWFVDLHAAVLAPDRPRELFGIRLLIYRYPTGTALAAFAVQNYLYPAKKQFLQYTTTSPVMHQRLGVPD